MLRGKLTNGFEYEIDDNALDNMELVDALSEISEENPLAISKVSALLLGKEQRKRLYDHLRTEDGRVPVEEVTKVIAEIFESKGAEGKN